MKKQNNTEIIDSLSRFRASADKLSDGVFDLSSLLLSISTELENKKNRTQEEDRILSQIASQTNLIAQSIMNANEYNNSLWVDYTPVIKQLGGEGVKKNG
ncbi:hypothetical protein V461_21730 [Pantoea ananatis BRT98]|uniref:hypothetical protein n=1 Tax=Pantoea ananas TaxID=553 RepID=UPI001EE53AB4|nr:hypothetical protein [Pantoea ananatis]PKC39248.1 hypothetical protein V461_21730 [Pantoea ananatis BRT98]